MTIDLNAPGANATALRNALATLGLALTGHTHTSAALSDFATAVDARISALGVGVNNKFFIDPHLAPFNAKGDGVVVKNGIVLTGALDRFSTTHYTFTAADIGKSVWCQDIGSTRTITAVSAGKAIVDSPFPGWFVGQNLVMQFGHDDTAALQAAIDAAEIYQALITEYTTSYAQQGATWLAGGTVKLRAGHTYLIQNSSASWNSGAGKKSALIIKRKTGLLGGGKNATKVVTTLAHYGHGIATAISQDTARTLPYVDQVEIGGFNLIMHGDVTSNAWDGIHFATAFDGYGNVDAFNNFHDLFIQSPGRDGLYSEGRGESVYTNINVQDATRYGVHFNSHPDYTCYRVNAGGSNKTGIRVMKARSGQWNGCKSYFNGKTPDTVVGAFTDATGHAQKAESLEGNCAGWHIYGDYPWGGSCTFTGCESQESMGSSWVIEANDCVFNGCKAADPGRISGQMALSQAARPTALAGFHLKGQWATNTVFNGCFVTSELAVADVQNMGWAIGAVYVDALSSGKGPQKAKGTIYFSEAYVRQDDGTTWTPNWNGGSSSGIAGAGANAANTGLKVNSTALT